ncbi:MAG TPA: hypothetical protein VHH36_03835 [Candidatus Thermoplasmatota archaeon]|nr:hypothetical protein [Candidatus Thermoplasmatota archaeon]
MDPDAVAQLEGARDHPTLFRLVKRLVERHARRSRAGIMLGLARLGMSPSGFLGGYFVVGSNAIVLNRDVLDYVRLKAPEHHNAYAFHVLLHEYLHTVGYLREEEVRPMAHAISRDAFGDDHPATLIAAAMTPGADGGERAPAFFRQLVYPEFGWSPRGRPEIEIVKGFDLDASPYIA